MGGRGREGREGRDGEGRDRPAHFLVVSAAYASREKYCYFLQIPEFPCNTVAYAEESLNAKNQH